MFSLLPNFVLTRGRFLKTKSPESFWASGAYYRNGAGEETRTLDVHLGKVVLYQLSYACVRKEEKGGR